MHRLAADQFASCTMVQAAGSASATHAEQMLAEHWLLLYGRDLHTLWRQRNLLVCLSEGSGCCVCIARLRFAARQAHLTYKVGR